MFEADQTRPRNSLWKILPVAVVIFVTLVGVLILVGRSRVPDRAPLEFVLRSPAPDYTWYSKYLKLEKSDIKMARNFAGKRTVIFSGVINNEGEKALDVVEVKLTLFNFEEPVWETTNTPIRPGTYTPAIQPLTKRGFDLYIEDIPGTWRASHAEMEIVGFRFAEK